MKENLQKNSTKNIAGNNAKKIRKRKYLLYLVLVLWTILLFVILTS